MALLNPNIKVDVLNARDFVPLVRKYGVRAVPHLVINERENIIGAPSEVKLLTTIQKVLAQHNETP